MGKSSRIARWLRALGWCLGLCHLEYVDEVSGVRKTNRRAAREAYRGFEVDCQARRLVSEARGNPKRVTAGELSERAMRRLELIQGGRQ